MTYNSLNTPWPAVLAQQLDHWQTLTPITEAEVVLAHHRQDARAFNVKVRIEGDGACLRATASETTLEAALLTATHNLERQIEQRHSQSARLGKTPRRSASQKT